jgi:hypothetical protein
VRNPFSGIYDFLFARSQKDDLVAEHLVREHHNGRSIDDILADAYVRNNLSHDGLHRLLDRPDVVRALGDDIAAAHHALHADH